MSSAARHPDRCGTGPDGDTPEVVALVAMCPWTAAASGDHAAARCAAASALLLRCLALLRAYETFDRTGAPGWLPRTRAELTALGEHTPGGDGTGRTGGLTPQELQVVRRAALGMSNREIAAELFLSPRTVGHHLYKAFPKLGVRRRAQLAQLDL